MAYTLIGYAWSLLSIAASALIVVTIVIPEWIVGEISVNGSRTTHITQSPSSQLLIDGSDAPITDEIDSRRYPAYFSIFKRCNYPHKEMSTGHIEVKLGCGRFRTFDDIPTVWWKVGTVTLAIGACFALLPAIVSIPACVMRDIGTRTSLRLLGIFQMFGCIALLVTVLLFPLGFGDRQVRESCGWRSSAYNLGLCRLGWSYYGLIGAIVLLIGCSLLSIRAGRPVSWAKKTQSSKAPSIYSNDILSA